MRAGLDFQTDLESFLARVKEREPSLPLFLLGHSLGGLLSIEYALHKPEELNGLIAISPALSYAGFAPAVTLLLRALSLVKPDLIISRETDYAKLTQDARMAETLRADQLRHEKMSTGLLRAVFSSQTWVKSRPHLLSLPLLMLNGSRDPITPIEENRTFFNSTASARKTHHEYEKTLHRPFDDLNRANVLEHIGAWLEEQMQSAYLQHRRRLSS